MLSVAVIDYQRKARQDIQGVQRQGWRVVEQRRSSCRGRRKYIPVGLVAASLLPTPGTTRMW